MRAEATVTAGQRPRAGLTAAVALWMAALVCAPDTADAQEPTPQRCADSPVVVTGADVPSLALASQGARTPFDFLGPLPLDAPPTVPVHLVEHLPPDLAESTRQRFYELRKAALASIPERWKVGLWPPIRLTVRPWYEGTRDAADPAGLWTPRLRPLSGVLLDAPQTDGESRSPAGAWRGSIMPVPSNSTPPICRSPTPPSMQFSLCSCSVR